MASKVEPLLIVIIILVVIVKAQIPPENALSPSSSPPINLGRSTQPPPIAGFPPPFPLPPPLAVVRNRSLPRLCYIVSILRCRRFIRLRFLFRRCFIANAIRCTSLPLSDFSNDCADGCVGVMTPNFFPDVNKLDSFVESCYEMCKKND